MIKKIDHVGIVVKSIDKALEKYSNNFGFKIVESLTDTKQEIKSVMVSINEATLELTEPLSANSSIARFLEQRGEGMHHLSFEVDNIEETMESFQKKGASLLSKTAFSLGSRRMNFVLPKSAAGVLIELVEKV